MSNPLEKAQARLIELRKEIKRLEDFIEIYQSLEAVSPIVCNSIKNENVTTFDGNKNVDNNETRPVDNEDGLRVSRRRSGITPPELAGIVERLLREVGHPLTRGEILDVLSVRDVEIPAKDKSRYIGTIMWRHKAKFVNIEGRGYWLRGERPGGDAIGLGMLAIDPPEEHSDEMPDIFS